MTGGIKGRIGEPAVYENLAEEAAELVKAALKMARILRRENPTPMTLDEAQNNLIEEISDTVVCLNELGLRPDNGIMAFKHKRWSNRIEEAE